VKKPTFDEMVKTNPDSFEEDFDCRPGPSSLDPDYSDSLIPEHIRDEVMAIRRKRRAEATREQRPRNPKTD
jgi:hypothetical protein